MKKIAISGYFDPIHVGHIEYINNAKKLGDWLVVIVNNNNQCALKKGKYFMNQKIDKEQNESFLEILQSEEGFISKADQKVLFITTDSWLAQLGSRKNS